MEKHNKASVTKTIILQFKIFLWVTANKDYVTCVALTISMIYNLEYHSWPELQRKILFLDGIGEVITIYHWYVAEKP